MLDKLDAEKRGEGNSADLAMVQPQKQNRFKSPKEEFAYKKTSINYYEERILKIPVKKIGELIDQELKLDYNNKKEHAKETKIMAKGLNRGRNF